MNWAFFAYFLYFFVWAAEWTWHGKSHDSDHKAHRKFSLRASKQYKYTNMIDIHGKLHQTNKCQFRSFGVFFTAYQLLERGVRIER